MCWGATETTSAFSGAVAPSRPPAAEWARSPPGGAMVALARRRGDREAATRQTAGS
ncbi:MAG: hypothetical protein IRY86_11540 [Thermorudis peleae]|nr:hypothetical protein [Thermorudis peleae]